MYKTLTNNKNKLGTITIRLEVDNKAFQLAILEEQYKLKVRAIDNRTKYIQNLEAIKVKELKELGIILNKIYSIKEATK